MKKNLLLILTMAVMLVCIFAISANAEAVKVDSTSIDMKISFYDATGNEVSKTVKVDELFNVSYKNDASEYYFKITGVKSWSVDVDGTSYNIKTQLAGLYFPEGITHMPDVSDGYWGFTAATADNGRKVHLPESLQCLGGNFLRNIGYVTLVNEDDTLDNYLPTSLTSIIDHAFCNWELANPVLYFPEGLHNIGTASSSQWNFEGFSAASGSITMVFLGKMTFIDFYRQENNLNLKFVFANNKASDLWGYELSMLEGSTTVASLKSYENNTTNEQTLRIYWHKTQGINASVNQGAQTATIGTNAPTLIFCDGDQVEYVRTVRFGVSSASYPALVDANGSSLNAQGVTCYASETWVRFYTEPMAYDIEAHKTADVHYNKITEIFAGNCGYDETANAICVACDTPNTIVLTPATGLHTCTDDFDCESALVCDVCEKTLQEAKKHSLITLIDYATGYAAAGVKTVTCKNEGCTVCNTSETTKALFSCLGYSVGPDGYSLKAGYKVNITALEEYKALYPSFTFGIVMANANTVVSTQGFFTNGSLNASAKGFMISIESLKYVSWNADVAGFTADNADSLELVIGIYAKDAEGNIKVCQFVNTDKYTTTKTYSDMSLNAITFNQVRVGHGMEALVPQPAPAPAGDEE